MAIRGTRDSLVKSEKGTYKRSYSNMLAVALSNEFGRNLNKTMRNDLKKSAEISKNHCGGLWRTVEDCGRELLWSGGRLC